MDIKVYIDKENSRKTVELKDNATVAELLSMLSINPVAVIVARNREIVMEDEILANNDEINILSVVSGG